MPYILLLGRVLFSSVFLIKAIHHFSEEAMNHAIHRGVTAPHILVPLTGILLLLGALSILLGYKAKIGACLLILFLVPATFVMHPIGASEDFYPAIMEQLCFMKNLSLIGSALMITYFGSGPYSLAK